MIVQHEIQQKAKEWKVPPDTVDKDYVLGHFLSVFAQHYSNQLIFKGGTCLRKCYIDDYRFSEDLDFISKNKDFKLERSEVLQIAKNTTRQTGIQFSVEKVTPLHARDVPKGFQVHIKYWGANHSKNQRPLPPKRFPLYASERYPPFSSFEQVLINPQSRLRVISDYMTVKNQIQQQYFSVCVVITLKIINLRLFSSLSAVKSIPHVWLNC